MARGSDSIDSRGSAPGDLTVHDVRFVLVEPSHCGNIGSAARAIRTMGFERLSVVAPREADYRASAEALALAAHADGVLRTSLAHHDVGEALQGVNLSFAMTGYAREFGPPHLPVRQAALQAAEWLRQQRGSVAFVFGTERTGLCNRDVMRCHFSCAVPADPGSSSLNLAQAVQVAAYEMRCALGVAQAGPAAALRERASAERLERLDDVLQQALTEIGFHDPRHPRRVMERMRALFARAQLDPDEADMWLGICAAIIEPKRLRAGRKSGVPKP